MKTKKTTAIQEMDPEIAAISTVHSVLKHLDPGAQGRVIEYVQKMLGHETTYRGAGDQESEESRSPAEPSREVVTRDEGTNRTDQDDTWSGVSGVAKKWIQRNDLDQKHLLKIFSVGGEEIDLIAKSIPGKSKRQRMREVILLKGIAAYLSSGVARVAHEAVKEACAHYSALDGPNFAKNMKEFSADISGAKETGYTLTARGLASGAELIKQMREAKT